MNNQAAAFSESRPLVSILILCYNKLVFTKACVEQLLAVTPPELYELIIVDNASTDDTRRYLKKFRQQTVAPFITIIENDENRGFVGGNNQAACIARGKYILFLNNDTKPRTGWLEALLGLAENDQTVGVVGAKLVYPDGRLQEAGGIIFNDASGCNYGKFQNPELPDFNYVREVDYCSGACLLVRTDLFRDVGMFDERYAPAYFEDADLCFSARQQGYKVMYQHESVVEHFEGGTAGTDINSGAKRYQELNKPKFVSKWQTALSAYHTAKYDRFSLIAATDRFCTSSVLVAYDIPPMYDRAAGAMRIFDLIRLLREDRRHVTFVCLNGTSYEGIDLAPYLRILRQMGVLVIALDHYTSGIQHMRAILGQRSYATAFLPFYYSAEHFIPFIREISPATRIIIDSVDVHYLRSARQAVHDGSPTSWMTYSMSKNKELSVYRVVDGVITVTDQDKQELERHLPASTVFAVPSPHNTNEDTPGFDERADILFVGGYNHLPNVDSVMFFYSEIWPLVQQKLPGVKWFIVGDSPPAQIRALACDNVIVTGYVEQVDPYLRAARVAVAPIRFGAGMKGKIGCAMAQGLPTVTSPLGAEGMGLTDGVDILIADKPEAVVEAIVRLYHDKELWRSLSGAGKLLLDSRYGDKAIYPAFAQALGLESPPKSRGETTEVLIAEAISQAYSLQKSGATDLAETMLLRTLADYPDNVSVIMNLAIIKSISGMHSEAFALLDDVRRRNGENFLLWGYLALVLSNAGQQGQAWECYTKALQLEPSSVWITNEAAYFALKQKMPAEAAECLERACELQPLNIEIHMKYADINFELKQFDRAVHVLDKARKIARVVGNKQAEKEIELMLERALKSPEYDGKTSANNSLNAGVPNATTTDHEKMLAEANYEIAAAYLQQGDKSGAAKYLAKCLSKYPGEAKYRNMACLMEE